VNGITNSNAATLGSGFNDDACVTIWENVLQQPPSVTQSLSTLNSESGIDYFAVANGGLCYYYLKETLTRNSNNDFVDPSAAKTIGNNFTYSPATSKIEVNINVN
jgi:MSHA pilin protein MshB